MQVDAQREGDDGKAPGKPAESGTERAGAAGAPSADDQAKGNVDNAFLRRLRNVADKPSTP
jgi:hypothetical protein